MDLLSVLMIGVLGAGLVAIWFATEREKQSLRRITRELSEEIQGGAPGPFYETAVITVYVGENLEARPFRVQVDASNPNFDLVRYVWYNREGVVFDPWMKMSKGNDRRGSWIRVLQFSDVGVAKHV
jgi:hypothetical protein